jgi:C-terminal processing protease CtpA/Prc
LSQFNIVWDYTHHQIFFEKNRRHGAPDVFDRAGFWINVGDGSFDVVDVIAGAPADAAGLKVGDRIVGVNGKRAGSEMSLPDFRMLKKGPVGTNLILDVQRGAQRLQLNVLLRDLV